MGNVLTIHCYHQQIFYVQGTSRRNVREKVQDGNARIPRRRRRLPVYTSSSRRRAPVSRGRRASSAPSISRFVGRYLPPAGGRGRAWSSWSTRAVICPVVRRRHLLGTLPINRAHELLAQTSRPLSIFPACCIGQPEHTGPAPNFFDGK